MFDVVHKAPEEASEEASRLFVGLSVGKMPPKRGSWELLLAYREMPELRQIVQRICESFAAQEWTVSVPKRGGKAVRSKNLTRGTHSARQKRAARMLKAGELHLLESDPLLDLLERGNDVMTGFDVRQVMATHYELVGECFAWKERNALGMPEKLWPLPPHWVTDIPTVGQEFYELSIGGRPIKLHSRDVFAMRDPDVYNPYGRGAGLAMALGDELDSSEYASEFVKAFFYNGAQPSGIVSFPDTLEEEVKIVEEKWDERHRGQDRAHRWHFFNKDAKVTALGVAFKDLSVVELRKFLRSVVRETWGVPPEVVGLIENSNRATIESAVFIFATMILAPRLERWRIAIQTQLVPDFDDRKVVDYVSPIPEDKEYKLKVGQAQPSALTRGEWRELSGHEPHEGVDDVYLQPLTVFERPADQVGVVEPPRGPAPETPPPPGAPKPEEEPAKGLLPRAKASAIDLSDIDQVVDAALIDELRKQVTTEFWSEELAAWGRDVLEDLGLNVGFNLVNPRVAQHLDEVAGERIGWINDTTREALRVALAAGVDAGEGHADLAKRVQAVIQDASYRRAMLISRTEVPRSANFATHEAFKQSGVVPQKEWVATRDNRVRDTHLALDGVRVGVDAPFTFGDGVSTQYPGASGFIHHDANERCTIIAAFPEEEERSTKDVRDTAWKAFDRKLLPWERRTEEAYRAAFQAQGAAVLAKLEEIARRRGRL